MSVSGRPNRAVPCFCRCQFLGHRLLPAVAGVTGQIIRVYKLFLVVGGTTTLTFQDGSTGLSGGLPMVVNGSIVLDMDGQPWFKTSSGNAFNISNSGNLQVSGTVYYTQQQY